VLEDLSNNIESVRKAESEHAALLGWVGLSILPILHTDAMVSLPAVPMSVVQSVIPISSLLIVAAEGLYLADLLRLPGGRVAGGPATTDALH